MQILADENIPLAPRLFGLIGEVRTAPGREINASMLADVDVLLVRSVTKVNAELLEGAPVAFVGSATSGLDHIDTGYLRERKIGFTHAPGSNAESVVEYVLAALILLAVRRGASLAGKIAGIVGCGRIGGELARRLPAFGMKILRCDPPLAMRLVNTRLAKTRLAKTHSAENFVSLERLLAESDVVTIHAPLTEDGPHATRHLINAAALRAIKPDAWLINTSRGAVIDNAALAEALASGVPGAAVLDVWEGEPAPAARLIRSAALATPHIAGYSYDGKITATHMLYAAVRTHFEMAPVSSTSGNEQVAPVALAPPNPALPAQEALAILVSQMYDLAADNRRMRPLADLSPPQRAEAFTRLRKTYPERRSFRQFTLNPAFVPETLRAAVFKGLAVSEKS